MPTTNPFLLKATENIRRRMFLKAIAAGLTVPAAMRVARMATAQSAAAVKRFFVLYVPHGTAPEHFSPRIMGGDRTNFALDKTNVSILGPLEAYKKYVNVYEGFQYMGMAGTHEGLVNCLSGYTGKDSSAARVTLEHVIGKAVGAKPLILGACSHLPFGLDDNGKLFWDGTPIDPQKSPVKAADQLFGGSSAGPAPAPTAPVSMDVQLRRDLLGLTASEIQGLQNTLGGLTREKSKLQRHLESIEALRSEMASAGGGGGGGTPTMSSCSTRPMLPTVEMVRAQSAGQVVDSSGGNDYFYQEKNFPLLYKAQLEVVAQALICNAARIVGLMPMFATCDFDFGFANAPGSHHNGLSHTMGQPAPSAQYNSPVTVDNYLPEPRVPFARAQRWFMQNLVDIVVKPLAATDDPTAPGTKVLDNTIIYVMSEVGDGQNHNRASMIQHPQVPSNLPLVTIGRGGGALKSGQVVQVPLSPQGMAEGKARPATDLYLSLARAMGASNATFPSTTGPVTEVLA